MYFMMFDGDFSVFCGVYVCLILFRGLEQDWSYKGNLHMCTLVTCMYISVFMHYCRFVVFYVYFGVILCVLVCF